MRSQNSPIISQYHIHSSLYTNTIIGNKMKINFNQQLYVGWVLVWCYIVNKLPQFTTRTVIFHSELNYFSRPVCRCWPRERSGRGTWGPRRGWTPPCTGCTSSELWETWHGGCPPESLQHYIWLIFSFFSIPWATCILSNREFS